MTQVNHPSVDEDLTPRFRWRWREHGIYLGVCSVIGLFVLALHVPPLSSKGNFRPENFAFIAVRYMSATDEAPARDEPFHDPRLTRLPAPRSQDRQSKPGR